MPWLSFLAPLRTTRMPNVEAEKSTLWQVLKDHGVGPGVTDTKNRGEMTQEGGGKIYRGKERQAEDAVGWNDSEWKPSV